MCSQTPKSFGPWALKHADWPEPYSRDRHLEQLSCPSRAGHLDFDHIPSVAFATVGRPLPQGSLSSDSDQLFCVVHWILGNDSPCLRLNDELRAGKSTFMLSCVHDFDVGIAREIRYIHTFRRRLNGSSLSFCTGEGTYATVYKVC